MADIVIRQVTLGVWTFSKPFARSGLFPFGGRSTAVRLTSGDVWVIASTPLSPETKTAIEALGPVRYLVSPDAEHHMFLPEYAAAYPNAKLLAVAEVTAKHPELTFAGGWGRDAPGTMYGFEDDIQALFFSGFKNKDVAFFHAASRTLIVADLVFNLPGTEQYSKSGGSGSNFLTNQLKPHNWAHRKLIGSLGVDKAAMSQDAKTVAAWDFDRIIMCHGDVIETGGKEAWEALYVDFLK